ncbi:hypothetical protein WJX77_010529 [Trebouxia sp. C0004]
MIVADDFAGIGILWARQIQSCPGWRVVQRRHDKLQVLGPKLATIMLKSIEPIPNYRFWDIAPWAPFAPQKQAELHSRHDVVARAANQLVAVFVDKLHAAQAWTLDFVGFPPHGHGIARHSICLPFIDHKSKLSPASSAVVEVVHQLPHWASLPPGASSSRTVWAALLSGHHSMPHHCCHTSVGWFPLWGAVLIRCPQVSAIFNLDQADQEQDESETDESGNLNESEETRGA